MPFPIKIQPIDFNVLEETRYESVKPVVKSRLKRLLERQFPSVLRTSTVEKVVAGGGADEPHLSKDGSGEFEPSSLCLANMVQNFIEESDEKQSTTVRCGRRRCNCFNGNFDDSSEDELETSDVCDNLKSLVLCASVSERNLLADTAKIVEKNKICKVKDENCGKIVTEGLIGLGYNASICKSRWEKSPSYPAGEYEYVDVIVEGERLIIDVDFRSEFEIARSTKTYSTILQTLPHTFVGKSDRLQKIISIVSEAAKQSLKKKGMHIPPWRKAEYVKAKWLSPYTRITHLGSSKFDIKSEKKAGLIRSDSFFGEFELLFRENENHTSVFSLSDGYGHSSEEEKTQTPAVKQWELPEIKPRSSLIGVKIVTGLSSVIEAKP